ncbi:MAG: ABC transporter permease [Zunongwangia sp.]|uniref:cell division protein FtsX n=1 Tax=Zunongwangia TaxID=417127 RepID=UPI0002FCB940|nr:ABC transporter permease [Zunongwangia profunda]MAG87196.1 ABC transporter permease [Flavobacteriaceae bacterium]MAO34352.1 ABC transporter permease [Zunongwangia sp.]MAS71585.1 ABC transporter permease [Zunongwangia sp.]MCC4226770.1 ABC transporter permease [Zunongwangia profunda]HAJ80858.1 ABC transporter permease [Zunongwangia profunda]|tara:strand:+ start:415 stop:1293 length:879 start_codon:yes stop_codon:yes gene_type:complete
MSTSFERYQKRRLISSYFSVVLSIALVLFLLGMLGLLVLNTKKVADHFKEQIAITVYFNDDAKEEAMQNLTKSLDTASYTRSVTFVSKEEAAKQTKEAIGEDFMEFLDYNPLQNSIDVYMNADFVSSEKVEEIAAKLSENSAVDEVSYDKPLISLLNNNLKKISFWVLIVSALFTFIAVLLINSSIRLSVYSKRFTIKTMQMVGATKGFIRRPFIWNSVKLGMIGAIVALIGMAAVIYYLNNSFAELNLLADKKIILALFGGVFLTGIIITWLSTFFATTRFLNLKTDELYY